MNLHIIGSSSKGNGYVLESSSGEKLVLEAGMPIIELKKQLNFNLLNISGMLVSHEHL